MSLPLLNNSDLSLIMEMRTECKPLPGYKNRFWWAIEQEFGISRSRIMDAVREAEKSGMNKRAM